MYTDFNTTILACLYLKGYKAIRVRNLEACAILEPLMVYAEKPETYTIEISDPQVIEMASGIDLLDMRFLIKTEYINVLS